MGQSALSSRSAPSARLMMLCPMVMAMICKWCSSCKRECRHLQCKSPRLLALMPMPMQSPLPLAQHNSPPVVSRLVSICRPHVKALWPNRGATDRRRADTPRASNIPPTRMRKVPTAALTWLVWAPYQTPPFPAKGSVSSNQDE